MAPPAVSGRGGNLRKRVVSAVILAPVVLAAVLLGRPWFPLMLVSAAGILAWEWARLCQNGRVGPTGWTLVGGSVLAVVASAVLSPTAGLLVGAAGMLAVVLVARMVPAGRADWLGAGLIYVALPVVAFVWLRDHATAGLDIVVWLMLATWAADSGAYFVGRSVGGPKLAPRISPSKTWSGFAGGLASAAAVGAAYAGARHASDVAGVALASVLIGLTAATGDLVESAAKRRFHVKDAGTLIPGHGGLLDRVDGLLLAAAVVASLILAGWDFPL
jgi:phosphatidate cytidylyltransferase